MPPPSSEKRALRLLRPDPTQRPRLEEIRRNLEDRIIEAKRKGWLGEVEGLQVSYSGVKDKLAQIDDALRQKGRDSRARNAAVRIDLRKVLGTMRSESREAGV